MIVSAADIEEAIRLYELGNAHIAQCAWNAAESSFLDAIRLYPEFAEAYANLAFVLEATKQWVPAKHAYEIAMQLQPDNTQTVLNYAGLLAERKQFVEAEKLYLQVLSMTPTPQAWSNLGVLYARTHRKALAMQAYAESIALDADYAMPKFNRSYLNLLHGDYEQGWQDFESRHWYAALEKEMHSPRWHGESLEGKTIFVGCEAGYGDMIQFSRYVPMLKALGAKEITLLCYPALKSLFSCLNAAHVFAMGEPMPEMAWDYWTPLLSLPNLFGTTLDSIPFSVSYLQVKPSLMDQWKTRLIDATEKAPRRKIGLVWQGSQRHENDEDRSIHDVSVLRPLFEVEGIQWVSLQKPLQFEHQAFIEDTHMLHFGDEIEDFADSAALLTSLDLLISVDTAVVHLGGALGVPCWVMLPAYQTDWRWLLEREDSPWYPSLRLFRQTQIGDWSTVVESIVYALKI